MHSRIAVAVLCALPLSAFAGTLWDLSVTFRLKNLDHIWGPRTETRCVSRQDEVAAYFSDKLKNCTLVDVKSTGTGYTFGATCQDKRRYEGSGNLTFADANVEGRAELTTEYEGGRVVAIVETRGKTVGTCE